MPAYEFVMVVSFTDDQAAIQFGTGYLKAISDGGKLDYLAKAEIRRVGDATTGVMSDSQSLALYERKA